MRSHAKASTAGSTKRQANRLGRFFRGAAATRGTSSDAKGIGAPKAAALTLPVVFLVAVFSLALGVGSAAAAAPTIPTTTVSAVTAKAAVLEADINPEGEASAYRFEYGLADCAANPCTSVPVAPAGIGAGTSAVRVAKEISGLAPGTTYHFRAVATNASGTTAGPDTVFKTYEVFTPDTSCANQAFRTAAAALPDCRGYEMVSPVDKGGGEIRTGPQVGAFRTAYTQASVDGDRITYTSITSFGDEPAGHYSNQYLATRGADGWTTHGISAPQDTTIFDPEFSPFIELYPYFQYFNEDLSSGWLEDFNEVPLMPDAQAGYMNFYRHDNTDGSLETITVNPPLAPTNSTFGSGVLEIAEIQGVSHDGSHTVFTARAKMTPDASGVGNRQLYDFSGGQLHLVSVMPGGAASTADTNVLGSIHASFYGNGQSSTHHNAVSADGSRIFWTAGGDSFGRGPIYVRINGATTVPVSAGEADWWNASTDGSEALYSEGNPSIGEASLKEFDVDSETTTTIAGGVYGVAGASEDLSYIYFASQQALDAGASAGEPNLYVYHDGAASFIATLSTSDVGQGNGGTSVVHAEPVHHASRVTPDGRHIAFQTSRSLTGYDNTDALSGKADVEVYAYDAGSEQLTCASCNPSGARPMGKALSVPFPIHYKPLDPEQGAAAWLTTEEVGLYSSHVLSDDGNRLFFNSFDALLPGDTNGVQDVYEWEAQGSGDCAEPGGCLSLISTGQSPDESEFTDADPSGKNVFFATESSIDPEDPGGIDIYDARIGGGFPTPTQPTPCIGDACQSPPAPPNDPTPASAGFRGAGDPKPRHDCASAAKRAAKLSRAAKQLRSEAGQSASAAQAKRLRRSAERLERKAKGLGKSAARCRRSNRGAGR